MAKELSRAKPPNAFHWYTRMLADNRSALNGRPFRSVVAALDHAAVMWNNLSMKEKQEWKEKARDNRVRFRNDPELRMMTPREFIAQVCESPTNGMLNDSTFWSRHWSHAERMLYVEELDFLENFDTKKRENDRKIMETNWAWNYDDKDGTKGNDLLAQQFLFISVQSSTPIESENYVPEKLAIAPFTVSKGIAHYNEFCCGLASENEIRLSTSRRHNLHGHSSHGGIARRHMETQVGDEDGCHARVSKQVVARLIFQRAQSSMPSNASPIAPIFFCLAEEFEIVYDALSDLKSRWFKSQPPIDAALTPSRFSVHQLATIEDLAYCLLVRAESKKPHEGGASAATNGGIFPPFIGQLQKQLYFDTLLERMDPKVVAQSRCTSHESDTYTRCPLAVIRLAGMKIKQWMECGRIPPEDYPLVERNRDVTKAFEWPVFEQGSDDLDESSNGGAAAACAIENLPIPEDIPAHLFNAPNTDMVWSWIQSQGRAYAPISTDKQAKKSTGNDESSINGGGSFEAAKAQNPASKSDGARRQADVIMKNIQDQSLAVETNQQQGGTVRVVDTNPLSGHPGRRPGVGATSAQATMSMGRQQGHVGGAGGIENGTFDQQPPDPPSMHQPVAQRLNESIARQAAAVATGNTSSPYNQHQLLPNTGRGRGRLVCPTTMPPGGPFMAVDHVQYNVVQQQANGNPSDQGGEVQRQRPNVIDPVGGSVVARLQALAYRANSQRGDYILCQESLPHGCRGIGRGLHLVPEYSKRFKEISDWAKKPFGK